MRKINVDVYLFLKRIKAQQPVVHHLTNWVTIYDCAQVVKTLGGSPVMAHAPEEAAEMAGIASALVLNIGTLTVDVIRAMKIAAVSANKKGIPVILDVCGAGATALRDRSCCDMLDSCRIDIIKGNVSEIARVAGERVRTKGVDAAPVAADMRAIAEKLSRRRRATVVITGKEDVVNDGTSVYVVKNGDPMMARVVGTGCMVTSVIGTFAAVEKDLALAAAAGLVCFEIAAERAAGLAKGPGSFKERLYDCLYSLDAATIARRQKVYR